MHLTSASPRVRGGRICGGRRGIAVLTNGSVQLSDVLVGTSSVDGSFLVEVASSGSVRLLRSTLKFFNKDFNFTGTPGALKCVYSVSLGTASVLEDDCDFPPP